MWSFQSPNQSACGWAAIRSIIAASAGLVVRHFSAWRVALESGSTNRERPANGLSCAAAVTGSAARAAIAAASAPRVQPLPSIHPSVDRRASAPRAPPLPARRDLLHRPAVAVGVGEEHEADVVERVGSRAGVLAQHLDLAHLDHAFDQLGPRGLHVRDDELEALER